MARKRERDERRQAAAQERDRRAAEEREVREVREAQADMERVRRRRGPPTALLAVLLLGTGVGHGQ